MMLLRYYEVIVVGYGVQKKQSLTGAVMAMKGDELLKAPSTNVTLNVSR
ncbi:hypothetical protein NXV53_22650 [Bacteroides faecis]|nr:hypothetical protein [Bacteroides faecis]MCS3327196.1 hypothetical protein [Bacteroides faecis]